MDLEAWLTDAGDVAQRLGVDPERGLGSEDAARRLEEHGSNEITPKPPVPTWRKLLRQFQDPLIYLLLAAVVVSAVIWVVERAEAWPYDAIVIGAILVVNAVIGLTQEQRADRAVASLRRMTETTAAVIRDGVTSRVPARELVPGDVLVLAEGDAVSADARLVSASGLTVSEAALTGESLPVVKDPETLPGAAVLGDRLDMVHAGTAVTQGSGRAIVTDTGMNTAMGRIAGMLEEITEEPTPLQREMARVGKMLGLVVLVIAAVVMTAVVLTSDIDTLREAEMVLLFGVSLAVAAVPEGLPAILSVTLALGVQRMAARHAIVKKLSSVETLGSASAVCSDKTGTLTRNQMTLERVVTASGEATLTGTGYVPDGEVRHQGTELDDGPVHAEVESVLTGGSLANDASLAERGGSWEIHGDPTDAAFLVAARKLAAAADAAERFDRVGEIPFTSDRKRMTSLNADVGQPGEVTIVTKGAPDQLLDLCTHIQVGDDAVPLDATRREEALRAIDRLSASAYRTLGVAHKRSDAAAVTEADESIEQGLVYAGTVGIIDPPRPEVEDAVRDARRAGIRILMITGDHPLTAGRIAADLGIAEAGAPVLTGSEIEALDDASFAEAVRDTDVYARVSPRHKLRIVKALQGDGHIVSMTGDGVNDAPALKAADIGVAMGITGTEVAKEASDMILVDDNFATIVEAVRQGRDIFDDIRKFLRYLLSSNLGEILTVFLGVVLAGVVGLRSGPDAVVLPLLATQILWVNLLTDAAPALAMGIDPEIDDVMARPPRKLTERVIDLRMWGGVLLVGLVMAVVTLLTIDLYLPGGLVEGSRSLENARTAGFTVLVLAQLFNAFNARSETTSAFRGLFSNPWLWGAVALSFALQVAAVHLPVLNVAMDTTPLSLGQWLVCTAMASAVLWVVELRKLAGRFSGAGAGRS